MFGSFKRTIWALVVLASLVAAWFIATAAGDWAIGASTPPNLTVLGPVVVVKYVLFSLLPVTAVVTTVLAALDTLRVFRGSAH